MKKLITILSILVMTLSCSLIPDEKDVEFKRGDPDDGDDETSLLIPNKKDVEFKRVSPDDDDD